MPCVVEISRLRHNLCNFLAHKCIVWNLLLHVVTVLNITGMAMLLCEDEMVGLNILECFDLLLYFQVIDLPSCFLNVVEPVSRHMEEQGLEFLQFAFRWFNCLLIREV